jgi:hypothetical protein
VIALDPKGESMTTLKMWCRCSGADLVALLVVTIWGGSFVIRKVGSTSSWNRISLMGWSALGWSIVVSVYIAWMLWS